jgi:hypothetical protein
VPVARSLTRCCPPCSSPPRLSTPLRSGRTARTSYAPAECGVGRAGGLGVTRWQAALNDPGSAERWTDHIAASARIPLLVAALTALLMTLATSYSPRDVPPSGEPSATARAGPARGDVSRPEATARDLRHAERAGRTPRSGPTSGRVSRATGSAPPAPAGARFGEPGGVSGPRLAPLLVRVRPGQSIAVRSQPGGKRIGRLDDRTDFGSRRVVSAVRRRGRWLGVAAARTDGRLGWIDSDNPALRLAPAQVTIRVDLSRRRVELLGANGVLIRSRVAIGRPGSSTPTGRFTVTDKLSGSDVASYYGCCILALSGKQPNLPPGWRGGDRLAIHGTNDPSSIGKASSAGCPRAPNSEMRRLMRRVPLGTPVTIRR